MNISQAIVSNISVNQTSSTTLHGPESNIVMSALNIIGIVILIENVLTLVILYRSEKLPFQIRTLAISLTTSDCLLGLGVSLPKRAVEVALR